MEANRHLNKGAKVGRPPLTPHLLDLTQSSGSASKSWTPTLATQGKRYG